MLNPSIRALALLASATLFTTGCQGITKLDLTASGRDLWQRPDDVVRVLAIAPDDTVADIGAGEGYFVEHLAGAASSGKVLAVEVDPELGGVLSLCTDEGNTSRAEAVSSAMQEASYRLESSHELLPVQSFHVYVPAS